MAGSRRALFSIVAMAAMLLSAGGIAYMASVSYPDELGIVDARLRETKQRSLQISEWMHDHLDVALETAASDGVGKRQRE